MNAEPFRIEPAFVPRIWGARSLAPLYPEKTNLTEPIGEVWLTGVDCKVATGPFAGETLGKAWREMPPEWRGTRFAEPGDFPILIKFIFPNDKLSIQVHPDDAYADAHEKAAGGRGKTEMWNVVSAKPGASLLLGLKPGATKDSFAKALENQTLEDLFQRYTVQTGDTYFVPARTPHTIGPDMVICEVQEYSDITYRVYDYGRVDAHGKPRELHVAKALEVVDFGDSQGGKSRPLTIPAGRASRTLLAACAYFATERWEFLATAPSDSTEGFFELLIVLAGKGYIHWHGSPRMYDQGQCWFLPASLGQYSMQPEQKSAVIRSYVPDLADLGAKLVRSGVSREELARTIFA
ncbi:MAG TPA: type I phosphomannose isomerase catalytic subunit [Candidatus Acidoferrum sp.]|nr:type I phosphomannose isomerase catalytic subunit [Candidatus Acidoferrum sp.]